MAYRDDISALNPDHHWPMDSGEASSASVSGNGSGYTVNDTLTVSGGTQTTAAQFNVDSIFSEAVSATVSAAGTGYAVSDQLTLSGGTGTAAVFNVDSVGGSGEVTGVSLVTAGNYTIKPTDPVSTTGGTGTGCTLNITWQDGNVNAVSLTTAGVYTDFPSNNVSTTGGTGSGCTLTVTWVIPDIIGTVDATVVDGNNNATLDGNPLTEDASRNYLCNAATDRLNIPSTTNINNSAQTRKAVAGWVEVSAIQLPPRTLYREGTTGNYFQIIMFAGNNVMFEVSNSAGINVQAFSDNVFVANRPYHVTAQIEGTGFGNFVRFYVDGILQSTTEPANGQLGAASLNARGNAQVGDASGSTEIGQDAATLTGPINGRYNHWATWDGANAALLSATDIREELFEKGAVPGITITTDTQANMQIDLDTYADTLRGNEPLNIRVEDITGGGDLTLTADNITHDALASIHVQWMGTGTLTWINSNGSDASIASTPNSGTVVFEKPVTVSVTALDASDSSAISGARVLLEADSGGPLTAGTDIISDNTNGSGVASTTFNFVSNQPVTGKVRKGTASTYYKTSPIVGTITENGLSITTFLVPDE